MVNGSSRFLNEINGKIDWSNVLNQPTIGTGSVTSVAASGTGGISVSGSPITTSGTLSIGVNGSTVINNLTTEDSNAQRTDYIVAQYAGGGTTTTTYHRRPLSKIFAALNKSDITTALGYTPIQTESDPTVPSWAKASSKPSYSASEISGLGTAATKDVPSSGNASSTQVVIGSDTRLTNSRPSSDVVQTYSSTSTVPISGKGVAAALATLPSPMVFKGTLGTGGTITALPVNGTATIGDTYKVITAGTYASQAAKIGDVFICQTKTSSANTWAYVPSGDDTVTDTWRNIKVNGTEKIGTGISSGAVDFVNGTNTTVKYNATGNKIYIDVPDAPVSSVAGKTGAVTLTSSDVGLGNVGNFKAVSTVASQGLTTTEQSNARANIGAGTSNLTLGTTSTTALKGDTKYAGASTAGGAATSAAKLTNTSKIGDTNKPVYFTASGVPSAISYTIAKSVPSDAVFTDTTYTIATGDANGQIKVTPTGGTAYNVNVKGLGSNAFTSTEYLPLAGGTTSGDIVVANSNSVSFVSVKSMDATIDTTTNNSVTANTNTGNFLFRGKDDVVVGRINQYLNTNGDSIVGLQAYNKMTNGTDFYNIFNITARKDGTATYNVTSPENFRAAIGVPYTLDSADLATDKNLSSGTTLSNLHSFTLQKGLWYINCAVGFAANASGRRYIALSTDGSTAIGFIYVDTRAPVNGIITWCQISAPIYVSEATTIYVIGYQNSGSTLGTKVRVNRLRLSAYDS